MDILEQGSRWLAGQLKTVAGRTVEYQRGMESRSVIATIGRSEFASQNESGVIEQWESRDFLIEYDELPFGAPVRGDVIVDQVAGRQYEYEVATPRGIPEYHYADAFRGMVRVHTKQVDSILTYLLTEDERRLTTERLQPLVA
jgi:hypothetical protein